MILFTILRFIRKNKRLQVTENILRRGDRKRNKGIFPDLKLYYRAIVMKTVWYLHKNKEQETESRNKPSQFLTPIFLAKVEKKTYTGKKDSKFNRWCWVS